MNLSASYRPQREGPEAFIEDSVANSVIPLLPSGTTISWTGRSLPVGAGLPDITIVACGPEILRFSGIEIEGAEVLGYLRTVGRAYTETIRKRLGWDPERLDRVLNVLAAFEAVSDNQGVFSLSPAAREMVREVISVEAKFTNWRKAIAQAVRNSIFSQRSYIALPESVAKRVRGEQVFRERGIGLLSVRETGAVHRMRLARRHTPRVWVYYYQLAVTAANDLGGGNAIRGPDR
jgi:hypothetical protein